MADGSRRRIDCIRVGDRVKTPTGDDEVVFVESGTFDVWVVEFADGTVLETTDDHPFPLKDGKAASIDPSRTPSLSAILGIEALKVGDEAMTGQVVASVSGPRSGALQYNLHLMNDVVYYVEGVACLTTNAFVSVVTALAADEFKSESSGLDVKCSKEDAEALGLKVSGLFDRWRLDGFGAGAAYEDLKELSSIATKIFEGEPVDQLLKELVEYETST